MALPTSACEHEQSAAVTANRRLANLRLRVPAGGPIHDTSVCVRVCVCVCVWCVCVHVCGVVVCGVCVCVRTHARACVCVCVSLRACVIHTV